MTVISTQLPFVVWCVKILLLLPALPPQYSSAAELCNSLGPSPNGAQALRSSANGPQKSFALDLLKSSRFDSSSNEVICQRCLVRVLKAVHDVGDRDVQSEIQSALGSSLNMSDSEYNNANSDALAGITDFFRAYISTSYQSHVSLDDAYSRIDFTDTNVVTTINDAVKEATNNAIPRLFEEIDRATSLLYVSATTLSAKWKQQMVVVPDQKFFTGENEVRVNMLRRQTALKYLDNQEVIGVAHSFNHCCLEMYTFMAKDRNTDIRNVLERKHFDQLKNSALTQMSVGLPEMALKSNVRSYKAVLEDLGMRTMFRKGLIDSQLFVKQVVQQAVLNVTKNGVDAAGAAGVGISSRSLITRKVEFNRPFVVALQLNDHSTMFLAYVNNPNEN